MSFPVLGMRELEASLNGSDLLLDLLGRKPVVNADWSQFIIAEQGIVGLQDISLLDDRCSVVVIFQL